MSPDQIERCLEKLLMYIKVLSVRLFSCGSAIIGVDLLMPTAVDGSLERTYNRRQEEVTLGGKFNFSRVGANFCCRYCFAKGYQTPASLALNWIHTSDSPGCPSNAEASSVRLSSYCFPLLSSLQMATVVVSNL